MLPSTLHYFHDPLCGWCYAATSLVDAAIQAGIRVALHGGGLWADPTSLGPAKAAHIRESDARIARLTGQSFGPAYLDDLLQDPATVFWSAPTIAAIIAADDVRSGAGVAMLHAIQRAHYVEGRRVVDPGVLGDIATRLQLERRAFEDAFDLTGASDHIERSRALMSRLGLRGFPGFAVETGDALIRVPHEDLYGRPAAFVEAVDRAERHQAA